jgi:hypothetical protein
MFGRGLLVLVVAFALAGCGGSHAGPPAAGTTTVPPTTTVDKCSGANDPAVVRRKVSRLNRLLARMGVLAARIPRKTLDGTPALSAAVDRFLVLNRDRDIPAHTRSRLVDHAAAIVAPVCEQCFQALEANRPTGGGANLGCG